jgi:aldose 1-epimerase
MGSIVGRYANRIAHAQFEIDNVTHSLTTNSGKHHIHGGGRGEGFAWQVWEAHPLREKRAVGVELRLISPDGQAGFPGRLEVTVVYKLTDDNRLIMEYTAVTDKATHINLTNHAYWNLAGADSGTTVAAHRLILNAEQYLPCDKDKMPTGAIRSVAATPMDFTKSQAVGARAAETGVGCYDHCYVLKKSAGEELSLCAQLSDLQSGRTMKVYTTQPGVQLYTGNPCGLCLETQHFPNSPNEPVFPSTLLRPGEKFYQITIHEFSADSAAGCASADPSP